jgi:hypothetical protein
VRYCQQSLSIYYFSWRLERACALLPPPIDALGVLDHGARVIDEILAAGPNTYQKKPTNRIQIESLLECVSALVPAVRQSIVAAAAAAGEQQAGAATTTTGAAATDAAHIRSSQAMKPPLVLDLGAGKALLTRAVYESLGRRVGCVALDSRHHRASDRFYDPPAPDWSQNVVVIRPPLPASALSLAAAEGATRQPQQLAPYMRVVCDVANGRQLNARLKAPLTETAHGGVIAISKHLCGGATDCSIRALCDSSLVPFLGAACIAPCCHQKIRRKEYCNMPFLREMGFCTEHVGMRGGMQDIDFRTLGMVRTLCARSLTPSAWVLA